MTGYIRIIEVLDCVLDAFRSKHQCAIRQVVRGGYILEFGYSFCFLSVDQSQQHQVNGLCQSDVDTPKYSEDLGHLPNGQDLIFDDSTTLCGVTSFLCVNVIGVLFGRFVEFFLGAGIEDCNKHVGD